MPALARRLGHAAGSLDEAALILEAYDRRDDRCAEGMLGDFAFVIWDAPRGEVFAARDLFGMRPLFYAVTPDGVFASSEIAQVLEAPGVPRRLDERSVVGSLVGQAQSPHWTQFEGVRRLRPGHVLRVDERGARTSRFWRPARRPSDRLPNGAEYAQELRSLLAVAIRERLTGIDTPGLMLSGGIDSTSIAETAGQLRTDDRSIPALATYSFAYDRFSECDERAVSDQVIAVTGQPNAAVPADDAFPLADYPDHPPDLDGPDLLQSHVVMRRTAARARASGVSLLMSGHRGDPLFGEGAFDYLGTLRTGGPFEVWRQAGAQAQREETSRRRILYRDLARRLPAAAWPRHRWTGARDRLRQIVPGGARRPPWIRADAVAAHGLEGDAPDTVAPSTLSSDVRRRRHEAILQPRHAASAEYLERRFARAGVRYGDPWSDRRIAEWILSVPPSRITSGGQDKWVLREAMRGLLPEPPRRHVPGEPWADLRILHPRGRRAGGPGSAHPPDHRRTRLRRRHRAIRGLRAVPGRTLAGTPRMERLLALDRLGTVAPSARCVATEEPSGALRRWFRRPSSPLSACWSPLFVTSGRGRSTGGPECAVCCREE